jgi:hypothetical protein
LFGQFHVSHDDHAGKLFNFAIGNSDEAFAIVFNVVVRHQTFDDDETILLVEFLLFFGEDAVAVGCELVVGRG